MIPERFQKYIEIINEFIEKEVLKISQSFL